MTTSIKFQHHYVTNGTTKVKVGYSLDNRADQRKCVTIYSDSYGRGLSEMLKEFVRVENDTDSMTDYFDKDRATFYEGHPLYAALRARAEDVTAKNNKRWAELRLKRTAKRVAKWIAIYPAKAQGIIAQECYRSDITPEALAPYLAALTK